MKILSALSKISPLILLCSLAAAQNVRYDVSFPSISSTTSVPFLVANTPPNSPVVAVCNSPANAVPCSNYATTFQGNGAACPNGAQDTPGPGNLTSACQSTADPNGNIGFWAPAGTYDYTVTIGITTYGPYTVTLGGSGGGNTPGGSTGQLQCNGGSVFCGFTANQDATINTATGAVTVQGLHFGASGFSLSGAPSGSLPCLGFLTSTTLGGIPCSGAPPAGSLQLQVSNSGGTLFTAPIPNVAAGSQLVSQGISAAPAMQTKPKYDIRDFGCVGNGVANDTTCIQNWLNSANASATSGLYCKAGTYKYTSQITYTGNAAQGLTIEGEAVGRGVKGCVFQYAGAPGGTGFYFDGLNNSIISNVYWDGGELANYVVWFDGTNDTGGPISSGITLNNIVCGNPEGSAGTGATGSGCLVFSHPVNSPQESEIKISDSLIQGSNLTGSSGILALNSGNTKNFWIGDKSSVGGFDYGEFLQSNTVCQSQGVSFSNDTIADISSGCSQDIVVSNESEGSARLFISTTTDGSHTIANNYFASSIVPADNPGGVVGGYVVIASGRLLLIGNEFRDTDTGSTIALVETGGVNTNTSVFSEGNFFYNAATSAPLFDGSGNILTTSNQLVYGGTQIPDLDSISDKGGTATAFVRLADFHQGGGSTRLSNLRSTTVNTAYPANGCFLCLAKTDFLAFRNNANTADRLGVSLTGSDQVQIGDATSGAYVPGNLTVVGSCIGCAPFAAVTSGTNTNSLLMGSGGIFSYTGTGEINANWLQGSALAALPGSLSNLCYTGTSWSWCPLGTGTVTVVGSGSLTSTAIVTGGGTTTLQTPSATSTLSSGGNMSLAGTLGVTGLTTLTGGASVPSGATLTVPTGGTVTFSGSGEINANFILGAAIPSLPGSSQCLTYTGAAWAFATCGSGGGGVTTFSSGNLSPLFTTSVATPTSSPALSFSLSNAAGDTIFGNCSGTSGAPSYCYSVGSTGSDIPQLSSGLLLASEIPSATSGAIGGIELTGDFGGTATAPTVVNGSNITNSSIPNSGLVHPSLTFNGITVALGASGNISIQTNSVNNTSLAGLNLKPSTVNASGLTVTPTNTGTNVDTFEATGTVLASAGGTGLNSSALTGVWQIAGGTWSASTVLANGTTATTQSIGDSSLQVATDQFVLQNAFTNPCTILGCTFYAGTGGAATALNGPTGPNGVPQIYISVPSGGLATAPAWSPAGTPIDAQTGTTPFLIPITDDVHFVYESTASTSPVAWTGFTLANNYTFAFGNYGTGLITFTPHSGTVNGGATQIIPTNYFGFHYTDNTNTFMPVMPTIAAFVDCHSATNALTFTAATGAFGCNSISGGGSSAFASLTGGTNTTAAMIVGTGASLSVSGSGTIAATSVPFSGITPGTNTSTIPFSFAPGSVVGGSTANFTFMGPASETNTGAVVNIDTGAGSSQPPFRVGVNTGSQFQVCSGGQTVVGNVVACGSIGSPSVIKFISQASGATVQLEREWQSSAAFTSTLNLWNSATAAGTGYAFLQAYAGVTSTDTTSGGGAKVFEVLGNGTIDVGTWNGSIVGAPYGGTGLNTNSSTGIAQVAAGAWSVSMTLPNGVAIGAATATSLLASGTVDGQAPVTITTGSTASLGGTYNSGYTFNQVATSSTAVTYTLPTPAAGKQYCVKNSNNGSAVERGTLEIVVANTGTQSLIFNGTISASGFIISGGSAGDAACVVGISSTQWEVYSQVGTWTLH